MDNLAEELSILAHKALIYEVSLTPKPGLVDRYNCGAHRDMNYITFVNSSYALLPYFKQYVQIGQTIFRTNLPLATGFEQLRICGQLAEQAMLNATNGVNTHKGANFALALILGASGYYFESLSLSTIQNYQYTKQDTLNICQIVQQLCQQAMTDDFAKIHAKTTHSYGERLYLEYGLKGPRGEAASGYQSLTQIALPYLRTQLKEKSQDLAFLHTLTYLMSQVEDGNLIHRGGIDAWRQVQQEAQQILHSNNDFMSVLTQWDTVLTQRYLSPGGSADLLSFCYYFALLERLV